ncbi:MAG: hypothetical protein ACTHZ1_10710 [Sphingobacterium sp.]
MKRPLLLTVGLALFIGIHTSVAQDLIENSLSVSRDQNSGTARFKAMGNIGTALGGDISSISGNPAGLGFYGQSDFSISLNYLNNSNKSNFFGSSTTQSQGTVGLENLGIVIHYPTYNDAGYGWQNFNFGLSIDKQNNFANHLNYAGTNTDNSIVHYYSDLMENDNAFANDFWNSYLVDLDQDNRYIPTVLEADPKAQQVDVVNKGAKYRANVSFGANYSNKFYIGASFGFTSFKYDSKNSLYESGWTKTPQEIGEGNPSSEFLDPNAPAYQYTDINYDLQDFDDVYYEGSGVNVGIGMIYKPSWDWNIGLNITTPTWTAIREESRIETVVDYYVDETANSALHPTYSSDVVGGTYDYTIISPWKTSVGLTKFFGRGLLSTDLEYVNYSTIKYRESAMDADYSFENQTNQEIKDTYKGAFNFKVGGEFLITNRLAARAGFNLLGSPYKGAESSDYIVSGGLGYVVTNAIYIDLTAQQYKALRYNHHAYPLRTWDSPVPTADVKNSRTNVVLTLGAKF